MKKGMREVKFRTTKPWRHLLGLVLVFVMLFNLGRFESFGKLVFASGVTPDPALISLIKSKEGANADTSNIQTKRMTLRTMGDIQYEQAVNIRKGNNQDAQSLGIYINQGDYLYIRQVSTGSNARDMQVRLYTGNNPHNRSATLSKNGSWIAVQANPSAAYPSAAFVKILSNPGYTPEIEFRIDNAGEVPIHERGQDEGEFFAKWDETQSPWAVYSSEMVTILANRVSRNERHFVTLEEMYAYFDAMILQYEEFAGLSREADAEAWNRSSESRYFISTNRSNTSAGAYDFNSYAFVSGTYDVKGIVNTGWLANHELGHGYDQGFGGLPTNEVWNNVFAHYFQVWYAGQCDWSNFHTFSFLQTRMKELYGYGFNMYSGVYDHTKERLLFFVNLFDKIGPKKAINALYKTYRYNVAQKNGKNTRNVDWWIQTLADGTGYNAALYFRLYQRPATQNAVDELNRAGLYLNVYPLFYLFADPVTNRVANDNAEMAAGRPEANKVVSQLGLSDIYDVVDTAQMQDLGYKGTLTFTLSAEDAAALNGRTISITDGVTERASVTIAQGTTEYSVELPIGVYSLLFPTNASDAFQMKSTDFAIVQYNQDTKYNLKTTVPFAPTSGGNPSATYFANATIRFLGLSNNNYMNVYVNTQANTVQVVASNTAAHTYFGDTYSSIEITDPSGNVLYKTQNIGTVRHPAVNKTISITPGTKIKLLHAEPNSRLKVVNAVNEALKLHPNITNLPTRWSYSVFEVTDLGLRLVEPSNKKTTDTQLRSIQYQAACKYMDNLIAKNPLYKLQDSAYLQDIKRQINQAYESFGEFDKVDGTTYQTAFSEKYKKYFPFDTGITWTIDEIAPQIYTGKALTPTVTVRDEDGAELTAGTDYTVSYSNNVEPGHGKVVVTGVKGGQYDGMQATAVFPIERPTITNFQAVCDVQACTYTANKKRPSVTVTAEVGGIPRTLIKDLDYTVKYQGNSINVGTVTIRVTGIGTYAGQEATCTFEIIPDTSKSFIVTLNEKMFTYTGKALRPSTITVADPNPKGWPVVAGRDYEIVFENDVEVGTATVKAVGKGNYAGIVGSANYQIVSETNAQNPNTGIFTKLEIDMNGSSGDAANLTYDGTTGKLQIATQINPDPLVSDVYLKFVIQNETGEEVYQEIINGTTNTTLNDTVHLGIGYQVLVYHRDPEKGFTLTYRDSAGKALPSTRWDATTENVSLRVTEYGLVPDTWSEEDKQNRIYETMLPYLDDFKVKVDAAESSLAAGQTVSDESVLSTEKREIRTGLTLIKSNDALMESLREKYWDTNAYPYAVNGFHYVHANAESGGSISPSGLIEATDTQVFTITPDPGYEVENVTVNGTSLGSVENITVSDLQLKQNAELVATFRVQELQQPTYTVSFDTNGGIGVSYSVLDVSDSYTLPECTFTAPADQAFKAWAVHSPSGQQYAANSTYILSQDTTFYAVWESIGSPAPTPPTSPIFYDVTVNGSYATQSGAGYYEQGDTVTIYAGTRSDYSFAGWTTSDGLVLANPMSSTTTFTMPDYPISITATWTDNRMGWDGWEDTPSYRYYIIKATADGGGTISPSGSVSVLQGSDGVFDITPDTGYVISDVLVDGKSVGSVSSYTFSSVQKRHTLQAVFIEEPEENEEDPKPDSTPAPTPNWENPFTDVSEDDWYYDAVEYVNRNNLMVGTNDSSFDPYSTVTREQVWMVLARVSGQQPENMETARRWAVDSSISDGTAPTDEVTRQQLATMLHRFAIQSGNLTDVTLQENLTGFTDVEQVSDYASSAMNWAVGTGIINGYTDGRVNPQGNSARAHVAQMLMNFLENSSV